MAQDPVPRARVTRVSTSRRAAPGATTAGGATGRDDAAPAPAEAAAVNHARYLAVLALGAFALPALATLLERLGAPRTPAGVSALLLAVVLIVAILIDRPREPRPAPREAGPRPTPPGEGEDDDARL